MGQVSATAGLLYTKPTFTNYVVESWEPEAADEVQEHTDANGDSYSVTTHNPGSRVNAVLAIKASQSAPAMLAVLTDSDSVKWIVMAVQSFRDGALKKVRVTLLERDSIPNPA